MVIKFIQWLLLDWEYTRKVGTEKMIEEIMKASEIDLMKKFLYFHQKLQNSEQIPSNKVTMMMES